MIVEIEFSVFIRIVHIRSWWEETATELAWLMVSEVRWVIQFLDTLVLAYYWQPKRGGRNGKRENLLLLIHHI